MPTDRELLIRLHNKLIACANVLNETAQQIQKQLNLEQTGIVLTSKSMELLRWEKDILEMLLEFPFGRTLWQLSEYGSGATTAKEPAIVARLHRLAQVNVITRPRKGHYCKSDTTAEYLAAIKVELEERTTPKP